MSSSSAANSRTTPGHTPPQIASSPKIRDPKISPDGSLIIYQVQPFYKASERSLSVLWLAKTDIPGSARPLTDGLFNDRSAVFHPDGTRILFLSDRYSPGKGSHLYSLGIFQGVDDSGDSQLSPARVTVSLGKKGMRGFQISPDGRFVAFTSVDDTSEEDEKKMKEKDDARVFGEKTELPRLRLYNFQTGHSSTIGGVREGWHVEEFTWSSTSEELLYRLRPNHGGEYGESEILLERISVVDGTPVLIGSYPHSPSGQNIWSSSGHVVSLQSYDPTNVLGARTLYARRFEDAPFSKSQGSCIKLYGATDDAVRLVDMCPTPYTLEQEYMLAVEVCSNVDTNIDVVSLTADGVKTSFTLFQTKDDAIWFGAWDAKRAVDPTTGDVSYVFAAVLSSGVRHEPPNVWAGRVSGQKGGLISEKVRLSSHLQWLVDAPVIRTELMTWTAGDGTELNGMVRYPPGYDKSWGPWPTVLFIHGGPYRRDIPDYMPYFCNWRELLASAGYIVVSPNYRGSQGRGHEFGHDLGIGVKDWSDCDDMVDEMIKRGLTDPNKLGIAGWSHGGSLTAWGVTQTKTKFKAAVVGAGVSSWEGTVMDSNALESDIAIGRRVPWEHDPSSRKTSPIHSVDGVTTAVLMLHGERDSRVPCGQSVGLLRALKRKAADRGKQGAELVLYPREPHGFVEQKHAEDVMKRVLVHFDRWI